MPIQIRKTLRIDFDIRARLVAEDLGGGNVQYQMKYYIEGSTDNLDTNGNPIGREYIYGLNDLALGGTHQSEVNSTSDYTSIKDLIQDYTFDFINGHSANKWGSGVEEQLAINLT